MIFVVKLFLFILSKVNNGITGAHSPPNAKLFVRYYSKNLQSLFVTLVSITLPNKGNREIGLKFVV